MITRVKFLVVAIAAITLAGAGEARAQAVIVTARLDTNTLSVGQTTTLRVFAQVSPALRAGADRIFSWHVDVLNSNAAAATARYELMVRPASDNDPLISSGGTSDGAHRLGIHDTFLTREGAGVSNAVELLAVPVQATGEGTTTFSVRAGTGDPLLAEDFIVAPKTGGDPWTGGDYTFGRADLTVSAACNVLLQIQRIGTGGLGGRLQLSFTPCAGRNHTVESRFLFESGAWQAVPGAPHNSGSVIVTNTQLRQVFRVRVN